jgi:hypothetical protein
MTRMTPEELAEVREDHKDCDHPRCFALRLLAHIDALEAERATIRNAALEEAASKATGFLVGDPFEGVPLRDPMAHEIADAIRSLKTKEGA